MMESGIGSIGSGLWNLFGSDDPYSKAQGYYDKIPGMMQSTYGPYIQQGQDAYNDMGQYRSDFSQYANRGNAAGNNLMSQYDMMTNHPSQLLNNLGSGFQQSPGYNFQTQQSLNAANRASAAGGMAGSPEEQQQIASITNQLANQDYYNYLNHSQQLYGQGINGMQGTERLGLGAAQSGATLDDSIYNTGANMADKLANNLGSAYMNQGNLAYSDTMYNNQRIGNSIGQIWGGMNDIFNPGDSYMGGSGWGGQSGGMMGGQQGGGGGQGGQGSGGGGMNMQNMASIASLIALL